MSDIRALPEDNAMSFVLSDLCACGRAEGRHGIEVSRVACGQTLQPVVLFICDSCATELGLLEEVQ